MSNSVRLEVSNVVVDIPEEDIENYVKKTFYPGEVFDVRELHDWAEENGYVLNDDKKG